MRSPAQQNSLSCNNAFTKATQSQKGTKMPTGSCYCGNIRMNTLAKPSLRPFANALTAAITLVCQLCTSRRTLQTFGIPKEVPKIADSGKKIVNCF
ncbi:hypothetical protein DPV78_009316 [Talaromyces pinophilus]|nr:hypothetical protein DPV78_009316 [Talaromyces pinophilus]